MLQLEIDGFAPAASPTVLPDLDSYDRFVVFFSGGKDSVASVLHLLESGVRPERIELHHHLVDGESSASALMDWPVTRAYCAAVARHLGTHFDVSWREGGFLREMSRSDERTAPVHFYRSGVRVDVGGVNGPLGTRRRFPQQSANLQVRWCSSSLKIDVGAAYLRNSDQFTRYRGHGGGLVTPPTTRVDWESLGSIFGIVGAFLLAAGLGTVCTRLGWICFLGSNLSWLAFARANHFNKLQLQTLAFMASTLLGIYRSFFGGSP